MGGKRLIQYDCKITYQKTHMMRPRKIRKAEDIRPGTKKGKLDRHPIWIVSIMMPKKLLADIYGSYKDKWDWITDPAQDANQGAPAQGADMAAMGGDPMMDAGMDDMGGGDMGGGEMGMDPAAGAPPV